MPFCDHQYPYVMHLLKRYLQAIHNNCTSKLVPRYEVIYWQNRIFAKTMQYVIPLSLITLIPGMLFSWMNGIYSLIVLDTICFAVLLITAFFPKISIENRKLMFIGCSYYVAIFLLMFVGMKGPGLLFLYAAAIFGLLILPRAYTWYWSITNTLICILFSFVLYFDLGVIASYSDQSVNEWIAISVNLIFLSLISSALIPQLFKGLSNTLQNQKELQDELSAKSIRLENSLFELRQKNEDLEQFAYVSSHDLQEPLRMVSSFLALLEKKYAGQLDDKAREYIFLAVDGAKRMRQVILDLLEYSRLGSHTEAAVEIDVNDMIKEIEILEQQRITESNGILQYDHLPTIRSYKAPLFQVFHNFISNALKYRQDNVKALVAIKAKELPDSWEFSIADNGIGIHPDYFDKIFVIFQRLHNKEKYDGSGIGLAIVKRIVENLGGQITVRSEVGKGSVFQFTIKKITTTTSSRPVKYVGTD